MENQLSVGRISEGFVLDHIKAGKSMEIYKYLHLDKLDCCVAIIKNVKSNKMGKKMILSIHFYRNLLGRIDWKCMYSLYKKSMAENQHHYLPCKKSHFFIQVQ